MLRAGPPDPWNLPTPCTAWSVRQLVNHVARGNLNYAALAEGGTAERFLQLRDDDALGADPIGAYVRSVDVCPRAFAWPGALDRLLDYPLGPVRGRQALAVRTADSVVHTWDLARALSAAEQLDGELVVWVDTHLDAIYTGLPETPVSAVTTHRFFAAPAGSPPHTTAQDRLLWRFGRRPDRSQPG